MNNLITAIESILMNNPAAAFELAARQQLAQLEGDRADVEGRPVRVYAYSASSLSRILGVSPSQWHGWTSGDKSPGYRTIVGWLVKWEAAGYEPISITVTSSGSHGKATGAGMRSGGAAP